MLLPLASIKGEMRRMLDFRQGGGVVARLYSARKGKQGVLSVRARRVALVSGASWSAATTVVLPQYARHHSRLRLPPCLLDCAFGAVFCSVSWFFKIRSMNQVHTF